jgi:hypothetical protein
MTMEGFKKKLLNGNHKEKKWVYPLKI